MKTSFELFPSDSLTIVLTLAKKQVIETIRINTASPQTAYTTEDRLEKLNDSKVFEGTFSPNGFCIVNREGFVHLFSPLIFGKVEETKRGSILFLDFKLSPGTSFILQTSFFISFFCFVSLGLILNLWLKAFLGLLFVFLFYLLLINNFKRQTRKTIAIIQQLFQDD